MALMSVDDENQQQHDGGDFRSKPRWSANKKIDVVMRLLRGEALEDVSLTVHQGDIHAIIGPNGAGKTSLLNCTSGLYRPQSGSITYHQADADTELTRTQPDRVARLGVARSFQNIELFEQAPVEECWEQTGTINAVQTWQGVYFYFWFDPYTMSNQKLSQIQQTGISEKQN